jgi:hypothetical protein
MSKRSTSAFDHFCIPLDPQPQPGSVAAQCQSGGHKTIDDPANPGHCYAIPKCGAVAFYAVGYRYVTGKTGRVSSSEKNACPLHATRFCLRASIPAPTAHLTSEVRQ